MVVFEIVIVVALIAANGFLAMSEIAVVASRSARLSAMAERGVAGAGKAVELAADPARFLSTVQIGITLVGVLAGAFSGATLGARVAGWLADLGVSGAVAEALGIGSVVVVITYAALVVGELVPKQLALKSPEAISAKVASSMQAISRLAAPAVWILSASARFVLRLVGRASPRQAKVTDEELEALIAEAESVGLIAADERQMIAGVLRLGDKTVGQLMAPREEVDCIDITEGPAATKEALMATEHSYLPAAGGQPDRILGVLRNRELLAAILREQPLDPRRLVRPAPVVREHASALDLLSVMRRASIRLVLVEDEEGRFVGVVAPVDILDAIAGVVRRDVSDEPAAVRRADGSWLFAGSITAGEIADHLSADNASIDLPPELRSQTVAGLIQSELGRLPDTGETVTAHGVRFEVVDLDGRRIDKVLATVSPKRSRAPASR